MKKCETCLWRTDHPFLGPRCQRYPTPTNTSMDYYCGEHKDRPADTAPVSKEASKGSTKDEAGKAKPTQRKPRAKSKPTATPSKD